MSAAFESPEWCEVRSALLRKYIPDPYAIGFVLDIGEIAEVWDDLVDKDKPVSDDRLNNAFTVMLTELPLNPFFDRYKTQLTPLMVAGINAWQDANALERGSDNDKAMAYVLRDWYVELVMFVIYLTAGRHTMRAASLELRKFFSSHETMQDYVEKLK